MLKKTTEANITIKAPAEEKISAKLPVFYNPVMKFNRDISILLLKAIENTQLTVCDLLAGTGIRSIRFLAELPENKIKSITINDYKEDAAKLIKKNMESNKGKLNKDTEIDITNSEASTLLLASKGFDYIDIDPFGTPNPFLDAAIRRLSRNGILAVTATDTSALAGTFPKVCQRKYWAIPDRGPLKHEIGLRILIRKVQLIASQYEKALTPIFSYSKDHYMRVFFRCEKGKTAVDSMLKQHNTFNKAGPMWLGQLWETKLAEKMYQLAADLEYPFEARFLQTIRDESKIPTIGFHDIHHICKQNKLEVPSFAPILEEIQKKGHEFAKTHFSEYGIRSNIKEKDLINIIKKIIKQTTKKT
jgi:tRNA (guanine26-N2/guanine27-N2)-dimethyltransferase